MTSRTDIDDITRKLKSQTVTAMAISRQEFRTKFANALAGALKEYTKSWLARKVGQKDYWSNEVIRLSKKMWTLLETRKIKGNWDKYAAAAEAFVDYHDEFAKCVEGFNEYLKYVDISSEDKKKASAFWRDNMPESEDLAMEIVAKTCPPLALDKFLLAVQEHLDS